MTGHNHGLLRSICVKYTLPTCLDAPTNGVLFNTYHYRRWYGFAYALS
jgi:hypothetical protein